MKNKILALTASLATLAAFASPAKAGDRGDKVAAAIGGFIGGVVVGSHLDRDRHHPPVVYAPPPVVVAPRAPAGYWQEVTDRVWVPERWVVSYDRRGHRVRTCVPGYYDYRTRRVWVEYDRNRGYGHNHNHSRGPDRDYGYGYSGRR